MGPIAFRWGFARCAALGLVAVACGAPVPTELPESARDNREISTSPIVTRSAGVASQQLPRAARPPTRALVRGRLTATLGETGELDGEPSLLLDARSGAGVRLRSEQSYVRIARDASSSSASIEAVRVRAQGRGTIEVRTQRDGQWRVAVSALFDAGLDAWKTFELPSDVRPSMVELRIVGAQREIVLREVELWGRAQEQVPVRWPEERLLRDESIASRIVASPAFARVSSVDLASNPRSATFVVDRAAVSPRCERAFLKYALDGVRHWTRVAHAINGVSLGTSDESAGGTGGVQVEEIPSASIRAGINEISFEPNSSLGPSGYTVRELALLCVASRDELVDRVLSPSPLIDGDQTTGVVGSSSATSARLLRWDVRDGEQPHVVAFRTVGAIRGTIELRSAPSTHNAATQRIALDGRSPGWHEIVLPDAWPNGAAVTAQVAIERESTGSVAELRVVSSSLRDEPASVVVTFPHHGECVGSRAQVRAFVRDSADDRTWDVSVLGVRRSVRSNTVAVLDDVPPSLGEAREVEVRATSGDRTLTEWISLAPCRAETSAPSARADDGAPFSVVATPTAGAVLNAGALRVEVPAGAVATSTHVSARPLASNDVRALEQGMNNVTAGGSAWRLGPSPMRFLRALKISVAIARDRLPAGKTERDVKLFYFDEGARAWRQVASEVVEGFVVAQTDHFTDWVAATVTAPEAPEASAGDGNSLGALGAGHPLAGVTGPSVPSANSQGSASTSIPIVVPSGRAGMQPSLSVQYDSSSNSNGIVGKGWSLPISAISIDTRFGVPTYSGGEHYLLDGSALSFAGSLPAGPMGEVRDRFEARVLGSNLRIVRVRLGAIVRWEVTDTSGTVTHYGETASSRLTAHSLSTVPSTPVQSGAAPLYGVAVERTGTWFVSRSVDTHANEILYHYRSEGLELSPIAAGIPSEPWVQLYPQSIEYTTTTGATAGSGHYKVVFVYDDKRTDIVLSGRLGFLTRTAERLHSIRVEAGTELVRAYSFGYGTDDFGHSELRTVTLFGADGTSTLYQHSFDYYRAPRSGTGALGFSAARQWSDAPDFAFESGFGNHGGASTYAGVGDPGYFVNIGAGVGYQRHGSHNEVVTTDINGDGLPDFYHRDGHLRLNRFANTATGLDRTVGVLVDPGPITLGSSLIDEHSDSFNLRVGIELFQGAAAAGVTAAWDWSADTRLFVDVDGDGLPDAIQGPDVEGGVPVLPVRFNPFAMNRSTFGIPNPGGAPTRDYQLGGLVPYEITRTVTLPPGLANAPQMLYRTAPLVRWKAQQSGLVKLTGTITRPDMGGDGVLVRVIHVVDGGPPAGSVRWSSAVSSTCSPSGTSDCDGTAPPTFWVNSGDRVYFLVEPKDTIDDDRVQWQPRLTYLSFGTCTTPQQPDPDVFCSTTPAPGLYFDRGEDFRLADRDTLGFVAHRAGRVKFQGTWSSSAPMRFRVYRRRLVAPPGAPPLPSLAPPASITAPLLTDIFSRTYNYELVAIADYGTTSSGNLGGGLELEVQERDALIFHFLAPNPMDPATLSSFAVQGSYTHIAHGGANYPVLPCAPDSTPLPGLPAGATVPRVCQVLTAPGGLAQLPENLVIYPSIAPAIGAIEPSTPFTAVERRDSMMGYFRGWSYAEWNAEQGFTEDGVRNPLPQTAAELITALTSTPIGEIQAPRMNPMNARPNGERFLVGPDDGTGANLLANITAPLWRGTGMDSFATAQWLKPSSVAPIRINSGTGLVVRTSSLGASRTDAPGLRAGRSESGGVNVSLSPPGVSLTADHSSSRGMNELDFFDVNGDGLPDSIRWNGTTGSVQLQRPRVAGSTIGSFSAPIPITISNRAALRRTETTVGAGSFSAGSRVYGFRADVGANATVSFSMSAGLGASITHGFSQHKTELFDINGDGLSDSVTTVMTATEAYYDVAYGLGYGFSARVRVPMPRTASEYSEEFRGSFVRETCTLSAQLSAGPVGGGATFASSRLRVSTIDINGDGLADRVWRNRGETGADGLPFWWVELNTGSSFLGPQRWVLPALPASAGAQPFPNSLCLPEIVPPNPEDTRTLPSVTNSWTVSSSVGQRFYLWTPFVAFLADIGISPINHDWSATDIAMNDIDGDGNVDQILKLEGKVFARLNNLGRTGLLRTITGPTGGVITLDYTREGNHVSASPTSPRREMPTNQWVLSSVNVADPGGDSYTTTFDYHASGNYDRAEREFYGFAQVTQRRSDGARIETHYHNQDYYRRGTPHTQIAFDKDGKVLSRTVTDYSAPPSGLPLHIGRFFPARNSETTFIYPGTSTDLNGFVAQQRTRYAYNSDHLVHEIFEDRDLATPFDDRRVEIGYSVNGTAWIFAATSAQLFDSTGNLLQQRTRAVDSYGDVEWVEDRLVGGTNPATNTPWTGAAGQNPRTQFKYDGYGNLQKITDPSGFWRSFVYDSVTHSRVTSTLDTFGFTTSVAWNHRLGVPTITTDANGVQREVRYDTWGRVTEVFEPYEFGGPTPTVRYDYALGTSLPPPSPLWARSRTIDPSHPGETIDAIVFLDGLGRVLQTKREIEIEKTATSTQQGWTVSGLVERDPLGRVIRTHDPSFSDNPSPFFVAPMPTTTHPARVEYDNFGRVWRQTAPNNDQTTIAYGFESLGGALHTKVSVTDPLGRVRHAFSDFNGNLVRNRSQVTTGGALTTVETSYAYDALDRLVLVTDAQGNETTAEYDSLGAMVSLTNPDTGTIEYQHTISGDLGAKITPNLRPYGQRIVYQRTYHRLDAILYPSSPSVTYTYGGPGASFNTAGRLQQVTDGSGTQEFRYGLNGETLWHQRVLGAWGTISSPTTTTMTFAYDSLGRMQNVTYPDGESVAYVYDRGGNLESAASAARTYVSNIHYDHFGRRTRVRNGNGTETLYTFDAVMQRLSQTDTTTDSGATALQALRYTYNSVGLISRIQNVIAPGPMRGSSDHNFNYDEHEQLVSATGSFHHDGGDERRYSLTMGYDSIGRTTKMKQTDELLASGGGVTTVTETTRNNTYTYAGSRVHAASQVGGNEYWYDNNGNQAWRYNASSGDWRALSWDDEDRLVGAFVPGTSEYFNYDAGGARTHKTDYTETTLYPSAFVTIRNGGEVTKHVWAGGERVGSVVRPDGGGVGDERAYWTHNDHLGGGHYVTTSVGAVYEMAERLPFGENWVSARAGTDRVAPGFAGSEHDESIGLNYHGARYYDAKEARWTGRDPALEEYMAGGGVFDPRNLGLYAYSFNSPVSYWDPDGRQSVPNDGGTNTSDAGTTTTVTVPCPGADGGICHNSMTIPQSETPGGQPGTTPQNPATYPRDVPIHIFNHSRRVQQQQLENLVNRANEYFRSQGVAVRLRPRFHRASGGVTVDQVDGTPEVRSPATTRSQERIRQQSLRRLERASRERRQLAAAYIARLRADRRWRSADESYRGIILVVADPRGGVPASHARFLNATGDISDIPQPGRERDSQRAGFLSSGSVSPLANANISQSRTAIHTIGHTLGLQDRGNDLETANLMFNRAGADGTFWGVPLGMVLDESQRRHIERTAREVRR